MFINTIYYYARAHVCVCVYVCVCVCVDNYTVKLECSLLEYTTLMYLGFCGAYIVTF